MIDNLFLLVFQNVERKKEDQIGSEPHFGDEFPQPMFSRPKGKKNKSKLDSEEKRWLNHMGYCTWFTGHFKFDRQLASHHLAYLQAFNKAEHVHWDVNLLKNDLDLLREAVGLPLGENGCYFVGSGFKGEYSYPPWVYNRGAKKDPAYLGGVCPGMPNHLCDWRPNDDGTELEAGADKFYGYIRWLQYLLDHFIVPWGYVLNGKMIWQGEEEEDTGTIVVDMNVVTVLRPIR